MADFSKWRMSCNTHACHETGRAQDFCYDLTTKEVLHHMFLSETEGWHVHAIPMHIKGKYFGDKTPDNGTDFGNAICHAAFDKNHSSDYWVV